MDGQNTLNNYKKGYPDTAAMGKLSFNLILDQTSFSRILSCGW